MIWAAFQQYQRVLNPIPADHHLAEVSKRLDA